MKTEHYLKTLLEMWIIAFNMYSEKRIHTGSMYKENSQRPQMEPCGTPQERKLTDSGRKISQIWPEPIKSFNLDATCAVISHLPLFWYQIYWNNLHSFSYILFSTRSLLDVCPAEDLTEVTAQEEKMESAPEEVEPEPAVEVQPSSTDVEPASEKRDLESPVTRQPAEALPTKLVQVRI